MKKLLSKKYVYLIWFLFDAIYIFWYISSSISNAKIPYLSDFNLMVENVQNHGGIAVGIIVLLSFLFQLSIVFSCALLLVRNSKVKLVCYIQIPFRLFFIVPSVSIILISVSYLESYNSFLVLLLVFISELIKVLSFKISR